LSANPGTKDRRVRIRYFGWSSLLLEARNGIVAFDPFYRPYCGARWSSLADYTHSDIVCLTHGHEEHFLDAPEVVKASGATVVASETICRFLRRRRGIPESQLRVAPFLQPIDVRGFRVTTFGWKHRDINLPGAFTRALFGGNATQLRWFWSSATQAPFYAPYTGFHVQLPDGRTVLNYNEGFNSKMTDEEIAALGRRFRVDVLLAGMQLDFTADIERGVAALSPRVVVLYPPHDKFHEMMGAKSAPWRDFAAAARRAAPHARIVIAEPGMALDLDPASLVPHSNAA
jgi:L-ascorbate metabolism protein UlaG (beta-lactamase superfamily)